MFVNSISPANYQVKPDTNVPTAPSFKHLKPEVLKNKWLITASQDIFAPKLAMRLPENAVEKEAFLELLTMRKPLDKYIRCKNEKFSIISDLSYAQKLAAENPDSPELAEIRAKLSKKGNIEAVLKTLDKNIETESKKNKKSLEYFKRLAELEEEYNERGLLKYSKSEKEWKKIINPKNNINKDENYSTQDLYDIISGQKKISPLKEQAPRIFSKDGFLNYYKEAYENSLRENINFYQTQIYREDVLKARDAIFNENQQNIKKFDIQEKQLNKLYRKVEDKFDFKLRKVGDVDIHPVWKIFADMDNQESIIAKLNKDITASRQHILENPHDEKYIHNLKAQLAVQNMLKEDWTDALKACREYENKNRARMEKINCLEEYDYLMGKNKTLNKYMSLYDELEKNNGTLPNETWDKLIENAKLKK